VSAVLGVPQLDALLELVTALAEGDAAVGLDRLRAELVAGRDPSVLYHELGRLFRTLVQLAIDASVATDYPAEHAGRLSELAAELGTGPLTRMIGLWVEQEPLLRASSNRELALEVACLRLARWHAVRQLEALLAGGGGVVAAVATTADRGPAGSTPSPGEGSSHPPGSAGERLAKALWEDHPRLAGAVEAAAVEVDGDTLRIRFESRQQRLGAFLDAEPARQVLEAVAEAEISDVVTLVVEVDGQPVGGASEMSVLEREARSDPQVALALEVLGGEVQAVRSDREPS
jgi:DNA polymerase III gamma/tau subunit